jgi:hypothetical protein
MDEFIPNSGVSRQRSKAFFAQVGAFLADPPESKAKYPGS